MKKGLNQRKQSLLQAVLNEKGFNPPVHERRRGSVTTQAEFGSVSWGTSFFGDYVGIACHHPSFSPAALRSHMFMNVKRRHSWSVIIWVYEVINVMSSLLFMLTLLACHWKFPLKLLPIFICDFTYWSFYERLFLNFAPECGNRLWTHIFNQCWKWPAAASVGRNHPWWTPLF